MNKGALKNFAQWGRKKLREELMESSKQKGFEFEEKNLDLHAYLWFMRFIIIRLAHLKGFIPEQSGDFSLINEQSLISSLKFAIEYFNNILPEIFNINGHEYKDLLCELQIKDKSFLKKFVSEIKDEEFENTEVLGWLHQFYFSKDHENIVGINNGIIKSEQVPAATQLFTPKWIVQYMVDNTLGKLWLKHRNSDNIKDRLEFYMESREGNGQEAISKLESDILKPEDIKFFDPACGCGNILSYAFDVFYSIYEESSYLEEDIPRLIIENNLYGLDIDKRAVSLAKAILIFKGREKNRNFFEKISYQSMNSNLMCIKSSSRLIAYKDILAKDIKDEAYAKGQIDAIIESFKYGEDLGSLISINNFDLSFWKERLQYIKNSSSVESNELSELLQHLIKQSSIISQQYHVVCTNPPYMSKKYMHKVLKTYLKQKYPSYNGDLFSVFMVRNLEYTLSCGYAAFMTPFVWMFIKEYEDLRKYIIKNKTILSLIQLEYSAYMDAIVSVCTFIIENCHKGEAGEYIRLSDFKGAENQPLKVIEAVKNPKVSYRFSCSQETFKSIPSCPIAYWVSDKLLQVFAKAERLEKYIDITGSQNVTANNDKYLRKHWEVDRDGIGQRWKPYTKGGEYRKWYGNIEYLVDWSEEARNFYRDNKTSNLLSDKYCFREGITYNGISVRGFAVREAGKNVYDKGGPTFHLRDDSIKYYVLGLLNSKVISTIMQVYNPTMNYQVQDIKNIPFILATDKALRLRIDELVKNCMELSRKDWTFKETSLEFEEHPFITFMHDSGSLRETFYKWEQYSREQFELLKEEETELNKIFIGLYGMEEEISPDITDEDITVAKADLKGDMINFISFAVGCILGRYKVKGFEGSFGVPLTKDNIFQDSLTNRFMYFVSICFGEQNLNENMDFIAAAIGGRRSEHPLVTINKYFLKEFHKDHFRIFKKRPVYWLFTSGERKIFNALVYMHSFNNTIIQRLRKDYAERMLLYFNSKYSGKNKSILKKIEQAVDELEGFIKLLESFDNNSTKIELNDGSVKNYNKFIDLLQKI